jgi:predicted signal transduction protein with EAL and GGDEF domain
LKNLFNTGINYYMISTEGPNLVVHQVRSLATQVPNS